MAWTVDWAVMINGLDLTGDWSGVLQSISVRDKAGSSSDACTLTVDDTGGRVRLPSGGEAISVLLEGVKVFEGVLDVPRSKGNRSQGRTLSLSAKGFDSTGKAKQPQAFHLDDATLGDFLTRAAGEAGFSISVDEQLGAIASDYWAADQESFLALGERLARQYGATFKLRGGKAVFARRGGTSALPIVEAAWGRNLIDWDLAPRDPRRSFAGGAARYFDRAAGQIRTVAADFGGSSPATNVLRPALSNESEAEATLAARKSEGAREAGGGSVTVDLAPTAFAEGLCRVSGAREGVDGLYRIEEVEHTADRQGGARTPLSLKLPE